MSLINALKTLSSKSATTMEAVSIDVGQPQELEKLALGQAPLALLVRIPDLDHFRAMADVVTDVGQKEPSRDLSRYLLNKDFHKAPMIEADFKHSGQAARSVRTLLANAAKRGVANLFIIGVPEDIFGLLSKGAGDRGGQPQDRDIAIRTNPAVGCSPLTLMPPLPGEAALEKRYLGLSHQDMMVRRLIMYAANCSEPVLILGETGTGKELVARLIHENSPEANRGPMMTINCGGLPENLLEAELFGYVKGAFTGADSDKKGLWEAAGDSVLFLDEIAEMPPSQQVKVLRALQEKRIRRVGDTKECKVNARIVAATNRDLYSMMQAEDFRDDLYHRLRGFMIRTPPLRKHPENIPYIARELWQRITNGSHGMLSQMVLDRLQGMGWPGNVRELGLFLAALHTHFPKDRITENHVSALTRLLGMGEFAPRKQSNRAKAEDIALHRAQCLRHLKRAEETLTALQINLEKIAQASDKGGNIVSLKDELRRNAGELAALCDPKNKVLFHGEHAKDLVCALSDKAYGFTCGLEKEPAESLAAWASGTAREAEQAASVAFREIAEVLKNA